MQPQYTPNPHQLEFEFDDPPYGYCQCGCGRLTPIAKQTRTGQGHVNGRPIRFCHGHNGLRSLAERFWEKVNKRSPDDCWLWLGATNSTGYGHTSIGRKIDGSFRQVKATHVSWELHYGPMPQGMSALHRCDNPTCVNPAHLFLGTQADNMHDMMAKGRGRNRKST